MPSPVNPDSAARIILLVHGLMEDRGRYWCYVAVKPSRYKEFSETQKYNIQNFEGDGYGEVVVSGRGAEPPAEVTKQVAELFGVKPESMFTDKNPEATLAAALAAMDRK